MKRLGGNVGVRLPDHALSFSGRSQLDICLYIVECNSKKTPIIENTPV
jgi:hypothetical protein